MRAAEHRVERYERERNELGDAARALLQCADHTHVLGELPRLLDVTEHHGRRRADAGRVARLDHLDPAVDRQLVRRDAFANAVVEHLGGRARRGAEPGVLESREHLGQRYAVRHRVDLHR